MSKCQDGLIGEGRISILGLVSLFSFNETPTLWYTTYPALLTPKMTRKTVPLLLLLYRYYYYYYCYYYTVITTIIMIIIN